jgi:hypothetical protein
MEILLESPLPPSYNARVPLKVGVIGRRLGRRRDVSFFLWFELEGIEIAKHDLVDPRNVNRFLLPNPKAEQPLNFKTTLQRTRIDFDGRCPCFAF